MYIELFGCYDPECAARPLSRRRAAAEQQALGGCVMRRSATVAVCLAVFVDMLGFGIILPSLPLHAAGLGGGGVWVGALLTAYAAAQFVAAPVLGTLSDRYGRRRLLLLSLAGSAISLTVTGLAGSLWVLLLARIVAGGFGGATAVGQAYALDLSTVRHRTRSLGLVGASIGLGFVFGPAVGAGLANAGIGFAGTCYAAAAIAAANLLLGLLVLPGPHRLAELKALEPDPDEPPRPTRWERRKAARVADRSGRLAVLKAGLARPELRPLLLSTFAVTFAFVGMETTFALLARDRFGLGPAGLGVVFTSVGVVMVLVQGGLVGRLVDRHGETTVAMSGAVLLAAGLLVAPFGPDWLAYAALGAVAAGQGLLSPTQAALISRDGGRHVGGVLGIGQSAAAAARAVGPLVAGVAFDLLPSAPYLLGAALSLLAVGLLSTVRPRPAAPAMPSAAIMKVTS
jgi:DHA1 family tetracycline resistance protein-like MFS transporter